MARINQAMRVILIIIVILSIVLAVLVFFLVRQSLILRHKQFWNARERYLIEHTATSTSGTSGK
jgi:hypothetical protein